MSSSQCPTWKKEKRICEVKATSGITYPEARKKVNAEDHTPTPGTSYAQAVRTRIPTSTSSTQTEPLAALPPLVRLAPLSSVASPAVATATTSTSTQESMMVIVPDEPVTTEPSPAAVQPTPAAVQPTPAAVQPTPAAVQPTPTPSPSSAESRSGGWQTVTRGRPTRGGRTDGRLAPGQPPPPRPPTGRPAVCVRGRPERQPHPAVRIAMGKNRSQSVGRYPPSGGNSIFS